jgi:putative methyltransferase (TIGR04325 family)
MISEKIKIALKKVLPEQVRRFISGIYFGWHGNYNSWKEAENRCTGYDSEAILKKVRSSLMMVKAGRAIFERDSVLFTKTDYSYPLLTGLMLIAAKNKGKLNILDFGGSLGSTYYQNKKFLGSLSEVNWCIVEQPGFVKAGNEDFASEQLHFFSSIEECLGKFSIDVILFSSVLQYLEEPFNLLDRIKHLRINNIIIDRTPLIKGKDRITVQRVNRKIYKASYPCWFFNEKKFSEYLLPEYRLVMDFDAIDRANIRSVFKGFVFELAI